MNANDMPTAMGQAAEQATATEVDLLAPLLMGAMRGDRAPGPEGPFNGVVIGELLGLADTGTTPLVAFPGQPGQGAVPARSTIDLHGGHIGASVVLMFDQGDPTRPIVMGLLRGAQAWPIEDQPAQVEVDADGQRLVVTAREQLVLRCGRASITMTKAGKVLIEGSYLLSKSTGVNRIKGGAVQLN